jgi:deoxyadenosine/deoxycytidine kinase
MIIGISGKIGSGKDTIANIIRYLTSKDYKDGDSYNTFVINDNLRDFDSSKWKIKKFAGKTGASIPIFLEKRFEKLEKDAETRQLIGMVQAYEQIKDLQNRGVDNIHFYTMNKAELVFALCHALIN